MLLGLRRWRSISASTRAWSSGPSSVTRRSAGVLADASQASQVRHLTVDLGQGVLAVGTDPVRQAGVVAGSTGQVAAREDPLGALAPGRTGSEQLTGPAHSRGQLGPSAPQRLGRLGVLGTRG